MDLEALREFSEEEMTDRCRITRDLKNTLDDTYDENNATYTAEVGIKAIYTGKCFMSTQGWQPREVIEGGAEVVWSAFKLVLPLTSPLVLREDKIEMLSSMRNAHLKGQTFIVDDRIDSSHSISQSVLVHRVQRRVPQ